jgi:hypothetical protein
MQPDCLHSTSRARPLCKPLSTSSHQLSKVAANCCQSCAAELPSCSLKDPSMRQCRTGQCRAHRPTPASLVVPGNRAMAVAIRAARRRRRATPHSSANWAWLSFDPSASAGIGLGQRGRLGRFQLVHASALLPMRHTRFFQTEEQVRASARRTENGFPQHAQRRRVSLPSPRSFRVCGAIPCPAVPFKVAASLAPKIAFVSLPG